MQIIILWNFNTTVLLLIICQQKSTAASCLGELCTGLLSNPSGQLVPWPFCCSRPECCWLDSDLFLKRIKKNRQSTVDFLQASFLYLLTIIYTYSYPQTSFYFYPGLCPKSHAFSLNSLRTFSPQANTHRFSVASNSDYATDLSQ